MKILEIESCSQCRYISSALSENRYFCSCSGELRSTVVVYSNGDNWLPHWCPLEDAEKDYKNENNITICPPDLEQSVGNASLGKEKAPRQNTPVSIHVHSIRHRLTDADGISAKAVIDGLVLAGILQDDSTEFIKQVTYSQEKGDEEQTIITLQD